MRDEQLGTFIPVPGMPQTLPGGSGLRDLIRAGIQLHLVKPVELGELLDVLRGLRDPGRERAS